MVLLNWIIKGIAILIVVGLHEYIKARVSTSLGDPKPKMQGRLTLNPFRHFEPIGFALMLAFNYGWGKPVETTATYYKDRKWGTVFTYAAPIISCLAFGTIIAIIGKIIMPTYMEYIWQTNIFANMEIVTRLSLLAIPLRLLSWISFFSFAFALFNLIPVYPLGGSKILSVFLNPNQVIKINSIEKMMLIILVFLISFGMFEGIITPVVIMLLDAVGFNMLF